MGGSIVHVLVVDDFLPWRRIVASMLQEQPRLRIVGEAWDGWEAVEKARELQPDLILLDIGLPTLNGIEAARRIRELSPKSKILFVSENRSWDIAQECLRTGAYGYVAKSSAASELLPAIGEVLQGNQFVTASLAGRDVIDSKHEHIVDAREREKSVAPLPPVNVAIRHEVEFYPNDAGLIDGFARLMTAALKVGNAVVVIATERHGTAILQRLRQDGLDVDAALKQGRFIPVDARETLSKVMIADLPDPVRCATLVGDLIKRAAKGAKGNIPALQFAENAHPHCWQKAIRRQRFGSNTFGMRSPEGMTRTLFVGTSGVLFGAEKAASFLRESAPNTRQFMDVH